LGRTRALSLSCLPFAAGWLAIAFARSSWDLFGGRLLTGVGQGAFLNIVPVYIAECAPSSLRGQLGGVNQVRVSLSTPPGGFVTAGERPLIPGCAPPLPQLGINVGLAAAYSLGLPVLGLTWRQLALAALIPTAVLAVCSLLLMPESPRWLAQMGRSSDALSALRSLRPHKTDVAKELGRINASLAALAAEPPLSWGDVAKPSLRRPLGIVLTLMVLQQLTGVNCVFFNIGPIFSAVGVPDSDAAALLVALSTLPVSLATCLLLDLAGRRTLLIAAATGMALSSAALALSFSLPATDASVSHPLAVVAALLYVASFSSGMGPIPWVLNGELFPPRGRAEAASAATAVSNLAAFVVTVSFGATVRLLTMGGAFAFYCICCVGTGVYTFLAVPETKGRSLEDIQAIMLVTTPAWEDGPPASSTDDLALEEEDASDEKLT
jgi:SP family sugar porter-like MFS transporter